MLDAMSKILGFSLEDKQTLGLLKKTGDINDPNNKGTI
jgi:hypothetical protein